MMDEAERPAAPAAPERAGPKRIDLRHVKGRKRRFLTRLAETYDMDAACAAAGLDWAVMCRLRAEDAAFAAEWDAVIAAGYDRIEAMLLRRAGAGRTAADGDDAPDQADVALARELLRHRGTRKNDGTATRPAAAARLARGQRARMTREILDKIWPPSERTSEKDQADGRAGMAGLARASARAGPAGG